MALTWTDVHRRIYELLGEGKLPGEIVKMGVASGGLISRVKKAIEKGESPPPVSVAEAVIGVASVGGQNKQVQNVEEQGQNTEGQGQSQVSTEAQAEKTEQPSDTPAVKSKVENMFTVPFNIKLTFGNCFWFNYARQHGFTGTIHDFVNACIDEGYKARGLTLDVVYDPAVAATIFGEVLADRATVSEEEKVCQPVTS